MGYGRKIYSNIRKMTRIDKRKHVYIELDKENDEKKILHISDTPESTYSFIFKILDRIKPQYLIHTGDIVDNIKLEIFPTEIKRYEKKLKSFLKELEARKWLKTYIVPGNHDSKKIIKRNIKSLKIQDEGSIIEIENTKIGLAHHFNKLPKNTVVNLYGHNTKTYHSKEKKYLNGLNNVNIILIPSLKVYSIPYPMGTNSERRYNFFRLP